MGGMDQSLLGAIRRLEDAGELLRVSDPVSVEFDLAAVLWELATGPTVLFDNVVGHSIPVVGNLLNRRDKLATVLDIPREGLQERLMVALRRPIPPQVESKATWTDQ